MGPQFLAGIIFGINIYLAQRFLYKVANGGYLRLRSSLQVIGFMLGMLAGYCVNHLVFVGFLGKSRIPLGGPGALSTLLFLLIFSSISRVVALHSASKSRNYRAVAALLGMIIAALAGGAVEYLVFVRLLGFLTVPFGGVIIAVGGSSAYLGMWCVYSLIKAFLALTRDEPTEPGAVNVLFP